MEKIVQTVTEPILLVIRTIFISAGIVEEHSANVRIVAIWTVVEMAVVGIVTIADVNLVRQTVVINLKLCFGVIPAAILLPEELATDF